MLKRISLSNIVTFIVSLMLFLSAWFTSQNSHLKYIKYFIFLVLAGLLLVISIKKITISKVITQNIILYLLIIFINFFVAQFTGYYTSRFLVESSLILLPLFTVFTITALREVNIENLINKILIAYSLAFIFYFWRELINFENLIKKFPSALRLSEYPTESWMAFPFGLLLLYYINKKDLVRIVISLLFFLLSYKRISFFALFFALFSYYFFFIFLKTKYNKTKTFYAILFLNISLLTLLYFFVNDSFNTIIKKYTGISVNHFSQGRFKIYKESVNYFHDNILTGSSLGSTNVFLINKIKEIEFLHSDLLKLILEIGVILFVVWLIFFILINLVSKKVIPIILFVNILFLSDNVFIYFDTLFLFYLLIIYFKKDNEKIISK